MKKYILLLFIGFTLTLHAQDIIIDVPLTIQEQSNWCGVAASQCVLRYFGPYIPQCAIMEYVRKETLSYGIVDCCEDVSQGCNGGIDLYGGKGSVQTILSYFGNINSIAYPPRPQQIGEVSAYLRNNRPLIISLQDNSTYAQHAVVVYGIDVSSVSDLIYFMDPSDGNLGGYQHESYKSLMTGWNSYYWFNTLVIGDALYPQHCFNAKCDADLGETDVDCGGPCEICHAPPPPATCSNCKWDPGEVEIDCGGPNCPPCTDVPDEIIIKNTAQLTSEVIAHKKITANGYVRVKSGQEVSFMTSDTGSIVLLPGFAAEKGSNFNTQRKKDLSEYSRICPDKLCSTANLSYYHYRGNGNDLYIYSLLYAVKIVYMIFDMKGNLIYGNVLDITRNGTFNLWDCETGAIITQGIVIYNMLYYVQYCNGDVNSDIHKFVVMDNPYYNNKFSNEEPEEIENLDTPHFSSSDNLKIQDEITSPSFTIIPNPNPGVFQLETNFPLSEIAHLKVVNTLGISVYEAKNLTSNTIQLQDAASGMFFVVVFLKDGTMLTQKMMVQR